MYRERERSAVAPITSLNTPSRLPVRSASLQSQIPTSPLSQADLLPSGNPALVVAPATPVTSEPEESDVESEFLAIEEPEPNLPIRYIHGAPLHNVLEEPEEEE